MIGIVYKAIQNETGKVVKIGSTNKSLESRARDKCYADCHLESIYVGEYEDSDLGTLMLRIRETCEIDNHKTWFKQGGRNILNPTNVWFSGLDHTAMRSYAGTIGGKRTFELYGSPHTSEGCLKGGIASGQKNVNSGWASKLGKRYGGLHANVLTKYRTREHQIKAGKKGGIAAAEKNLESGWCTKLAAIGTHNRWHVKRGKVSETCSLCNQ